MATKATRRPANGRLEEAVATLINTQADFVRQVARMEENYARIMEQFSQMKDILIHHQHTLDALPEAIRQKIGFKPR